MCKRLTQGGSAVFLLAICFLWPVAPAAGQNFALDFTNNRVEIPYIGTGVNFAEISLEAWVYWRGHTSSEGTSGIMEGRGGTLHWQLNANSNVRIRLEGVDQNANANVQQNEWFHLAVTYSRAALALRCYKNGTVFHTFSGNSNTNTFWTSGDAQFGTSYRAGDRRWNGMIDELRVWNTVRTEAQIQENMGQELPGTEEGLIAYWKLNEGQGTTAVDSGPKGHHGTIVGATWTTNAAPVSPLGFAYGAVPALGATDVPRDTILSWTPGKDTQRSNVYFGTDRAAVEAADPTKPLGVLVNQGQTATTYVPAGVLEYGQTYYWRVDGITAAPASTVFTGRVWSFTVESYGYPIKPIAATASSAQPDMGPEKTINGSGMTGDLHGTEPTTMWLSAGVQPNWIQYEFDQAYKLHELWVWNSNQMIEPFIGFGAKSVKIGHSLDGSAWTEVTAAAEFGRGTGLAAYGSNTAVPLGGVVAKYIRLNILSAWGVAPQAGLSEVRFFYVPVQAREPVPAAGATGIDLDATLRWRPGREAASHQVYFGTDRDAVAGGTAPAKSLTDNRFDPPTLAFGATYFWRVDEVGETGTYAGDVWSFTTKDSAVVEDFESYTDTDGNRIYQSWVDGEENKSGSVVGHLTAPFAERTVVRGGKQSMPLEYDNTKSPFYSEAELTFATPQDWTANGIKSLSLWFYGVAGNGGQLYVKINGTKVLYDGEAADLARAGWQVWNIDLSKAGQVNRVRTLAIGIEGNGTKGRLYIDDIRLYPKTPAYSTPVQPAATGLVAHYTFDETTGSRAADSSGKNNHGTAAGGYRWGAGKIGGAIELTGDGYVVIDGVAPNFTTNSDMTLSAWIKTTQGSEGTLFAANTSGSDYALLFGIQGGNPYRWDGADVQYPPAVNDNEWHLLTYVRDGDMAYIYVDGMQRAAWATTRSFSAAVRWSIGQEWDTNASDFYIGLVDDARVYDRALSAAEVAGLAGQTKPRHAPF